jgi:hypothetical protein
MDINSLRPDPAPARRVESVPAVNDEQRPPESSIERHDDADGGDTVEISEEARARAAQATDEVPSGTMAPERLAEVRRLIMDRAQDADAVADATMRRIVQSGDLW